MSQFNLILIDYLILCIAFFAYMQVRPHRVHQILYFCSLKNLCINIYLFIIIFYLHAHFDCTYM